MVVFEDFYQFAISVDTRLKLNVHKMLIWCPGMAWELFKVSEVALLQNIFQLLLLYVEQLCIPYFL